MGLFNKLIMQFSKEQVEKLNEPILGANVKEREAGWGGKDNTLAYVEGFTSLLKLTSSSGLVVGVVKLSKQPVFKTNLEPSVTLPK